MKKTITEMLQTKKERKFAESVELQIGLRDYDPEKDKRFTGSIKLPTTVKPRLSVAVIGSAAHCLQCNKDNIPCIDQDGLKKFNKDKKQIKKWAKPYDVLICSESLMKMLPKLCGNVLVKIGKFPMMMQDSETPVEKVKEVKATVKFQLKKVLCLGTAVANVEQSEDEIRRNLTMAINFLVSLLKKGWQNIKSLHIKTSMGKSHRIFG